MKASGFAATSPKYLYNALASSMDRVALVYKMEKPVINMCLVVPGVSVLRSNYSMLQASKRLTCLVCDNYYALRSISMRVVDCKKPDNVVFCEYNTQQDVDLVELSAHARKWEFKKRDINLFKKLMKQTKQSIVGEIQNQLFTIRDTKLRETTKQKIVEGMLTQNMSQAVLWIMKQFRGSEAIIGLITGQECTKLVQALDRAVRGEDTMVIAHDLSISQYDINYIMAYAKKTNLLGNK